MLWVGIAGLVLAIPLGYQLAERQSARGPTVGWPGGWLCAAIVIELVIAFTWGLVHAV